MKRKPLPPGDVFEAYVRYTAGDYATAKEMHELWAKAFPAIHGAWDTFEADKLAVELRQKLSSCQCAVCQL